LKKFRRRKTLRDTRHLPYDLIGDKNIAQFCACGQQPSSDKRPVKTHKTQQVPLSQAQKQKQKKPDPDPDSAIKRSSQCTAKRKKLQKSRRETYKNKREKQSRVKRNRSMTRQP